MTGHRFSAKVPKEVVRRQQIACCYGSSSRGTNSREQEDMNPLRSQNDVGLQEHKSLHYTKDRLTKESAERKQLQRHARSKLDSLMFPRKWRLTLFPCRDSSEAMSGGNFELAWIMLLCKDTSGLCRLPQPRPAVQAALQP